MIRIALFLVVACGTSASPPKQKKPAPAPTPIDAAPPALSAELRAKWQSGCFLMHTTRGPVENDHAKCTTGRRPYSTFKLANALIALDAGVLPGADAPMSWDKRAVPDEKRYRDEWRKPQTLRSALKVSAVPHFRTLAHTLGAERMAAGLAKLDYGNRNMGGGLDQFWLRGDLRISAEQQLAFVDALARGKLGVSREAQATVREISELERNGTAVLHGKTGSGPNTDLGEPASEESFLVWQVGWIGSGTEIQPYAVWLEVNGGTFDEARVKRDQLLRATFSELGVWGGP